MRDLQAAVACDPTGLGTSQAIDLLQGLKRLRGFLDRVEADVAARVAALHAAGKSAPAADVLARSQGVSSREAGRRERRSKVLDEAPTFGDALASGRVNAEHADVLATVTAKVPDHVRAELFDRQDALVERASSQSPEQFAKHVRGVLDRLTADDGVERNARQRSETYLSKRIDRDGMYVVNARLHPELGTRVFNDLDRQTDAMAATREYAGIDRATVAAEALGALIGAGHGEIRPTIAEAVVLIDDQTLLQGAHEQTVAELDGGVELPVESIRRICCNAGIIPMVLDGAGVVLDQGRAKRLATHEQRLALRVMYRTCMFPGCDVIFDDCEIHHTTPWEQGGSTNLADLGPVCSRHHHVVHEGGFRLEIQVDRTTVARAPDGSVYATAPPQTRRRTHDETAPSLAA